MKWLGWQTFNDRLGLVIMLGLPGLWVANHWYALPPEALGATIAMWVMVGQFFFRKAPPNGPPT